MKASSVETCGICEASALTLLWDLPRLPLTEKYGEYSLAKELHFDQRLLICEECGHIQLGEQISPHLLYTPSEYSFRTGQSQTGRAGALLFSQFISSVVEGKTVQSLLDVGGNDLFVAKIVEARARCVIDPVCAPDHGKMVDGVKILGQFIEDLDFKKEGLCPDLIVCRHVLEHVASPRKMVETLFQNCAPEALYVFEIPCFDNLVEANRWDAIFHQHYHYFDLATFKHLILSAGGEYIAHRYNRQGGCGGSLLIAFRKSRFAAKREVSFSTPISDKKRHLKESIDRYRSQMALLSYQLQKFSKNLYGYGASLMLATLAYHLNTDFSELICILDDDEEKNGMGYQNVPVKIQHPKYCNITPESNFLITSLENVRKIYKKISESAPRRILVPLVS